MKSRKLICVAALTLFAAMPTVLASTTWYVNGMSGSDSNNCMSAQTACKRIGHAISLAASGDSITVGAATYAENLTIGFSLGIVGSGASTTVIDGGGKNTVVTIPNTSARVTLSKVAIRNGLAASGGGIYNSGALTISHSILIANGAHAHGGGGIYNKGALTIKNCTLTRNSASNLTIFSGASGGGIYNAGTLTINNSILSNNSMTATDIALASGGGVSNLGMLRISNSTLSGNTASNSSHGLRSVGGGISNGGTLTISNSTFSENSAGGDGGGISNGGTLTINNSTLSRNSAATGGGIWNYDTSPATLQNSIFANSPNGGNCSGPMTSNGYNLSSDNTCNFNNTGDQNNTDPRLGPLQNNGGLTPTMALPSGSPAIDAGNPSGCTDSQGHLLKTDQRGKPRPDTEDTGGCDMGAFERQSD
jgi:hypothetical protein